MRFSGILNSSLCASKWLATSASLAVTCGRKLSAVKLTTASFTLSLRRRYSCLELLVGHRQPVGHRRAQLVDREAAADVVLELEAIIGGRCMPEQLLVAGLADEAAVLLERRDREDPLPHLLVADRDAEPVGLGERGPFVDHLLEDLLLDAELLQQLFVHVARRRPSGRPAVELGSVRRNSAPVISWPSTFATGVARGRVGAGAAQEIGDVEEHERHAAQGPGST